MIHLVADLAWPIISRIPVVGDVAVSPHGIATAAGAFVGGAMMVRRAQRTGIVDPAGAVDGTGPAPSVEDPAEAADEVSRQVQSLLGWVLVGGIVGARLFFVLTHLDQFVAEPWRIPFAWEGGLTFIGGVTGGVALGWWVARRRGLSPLRLLDAAAPGLAVGLAIGRLGDLAIGDHLGLPTTAWYGWRCTGDLNPVGGPNVLAWTPPLPWPESAVASGAVPAPVVGCFDTAVAQTALVDLVAALVVVVALAVVARRHPAVGSLAAMWVIAYGVARILGDVLRGDRRVLGLTGTQWAMTVAVGTVVVMVVRRRARSRAAGQT